MIVGEGLGDVVVGAFAQGLDRRLDTGVCGDDDAHQFGVEVAHPPQQIEAAATAAQVKVENRQIDFLAIEDSEGACRGVGFKHLVSLAAQQLDDDRAHQLLVFDHQDAVGAAFRRGPSLAVIVRLAVHCAPVEFSCRAFSLRTGRQMVTVVPCATLLSTRIVPWLVSTMLWHSDKPRPTPAPAGLVVKNGSNTRSRLSGSIPQPLSTTRINTRPSLCWLRAFSVMTRITPSPLWEASAALNSRFSSTCWMPLW